MKNRIAQSAALSPMEKSRGFAYFIFQLLFLPAMLLWANERWGQLLSIAALNLVYYTVNFAAASLLFRGFLTQSGPYTLRHPAIFCQSVILGLAACYLCRWAIQALICHVLPSFQNYNDESIAAMTREHFLMMLVGTVILVPPVEECFYRGLIFRSLWSKSPWGAYLISAFAFALVHIFGYLGQYSPAQLLIALLQYLAPGLCLAWSYEKSGSIFAPMSIHAFINFTTILSMR